MASSIEELIGRQVGRYTIVRHLESGGMAELYIARQEAMGGFEKEIVLKLLQERYAESRRVVQMFLDEARLSAKLNHPSIVHVYDVADEQGVKYIAMEYIHGETLLDIIRRGIAVEKPLPLEHALHVIGQTAAGLGYAHERRESDGRPLRIVHRDVSPTNVMVTYQGQTKIVDFGIARIQDELREESGVLPGKASYMSPEQVRGEAVDYRSDIFSLGIMLYEITVGQRLFRGKPEVVMKRIVDDKIPPPTYVRRDFPPALELIVMRALEKRPEDRYQSAEELRHELEDFLENAGLRTGNRRMALYMNEIFAPEAEVSVTSAEQARGFAETGGASLAPRNDVSEELNFDRRAPLTMRLEPAPPESEPMSRYNRPPLPPELVSSPTLGPAPAPAATKTNGVHAGGAVVAAAAPAAATVLSPSEPERNRVSTGWILAAVTVFLLGIAAMVFFAAR
jgi:serine/threonine protein kinase